MAPKGHEEKPAAQPQPAEEAHEEAEDISIGGFVVSAATFWTVLILGTLITAGLLFKFGNEGYFDGKAEKCVQHWYYIVNQYTTCSKLTVKPPAVLIFNDGWVWGFVAALCIFVWGPNPITKRLAGLKTFGSVLVSIIAPGFFFLATSIGFQHERISPLVARNPPLAWLTAFILTGLIFVIGMFQQAD